MKPNQLKRPDAPRIWLRIDKSHVAKIIKARRALCVGEEFIAVNGAQRTQ